MKIDGNLWDKWNRAIIDARSAYSRGVMRALANTGAHEYTPGCNCENCFTIWLWSNDPDTGKCEE